MNREKKAHDWPVSAGGRLVERFDPDESGFAKMESTNDRLRARARGGARGALPISQQAS
jgi:hypothetical protein